MCHHQGSSPRGNGTDLCMEIILFVFWRLNFQTMLPCLKEVLPVLQTMIVEAPAVLNDQPLTYTSSEINDTQPLTPGHLLYGRKIIRLPY